MSQSARRYSGQLAEERDASRRERLMAAALELFGTQGFAGTSVDRICSTAGVSTRNFYEYFDNKEAMFLAVYGAITSQSFDRAAVALEETADRPITERISRAFIAYIGPMIEDARNTRIAFVETVGASPKIEETRLEFREALIELITAEGTAAVERGEVTPRDFRIAALVLAGASNAIVYDWWRRPERSSVEELEQVLTELAVRTLAG
jgi:AcrR family transcriptional regulator